MSFWYQRRPEVFFVYAVDPLDVIRERRAGISRRRDGYRAGPGAAGAGRAEHRGMAGVTPAEHDLSEKETSHSYAYWCENDKSLGDFGDCKKVFRVPVPIIRPGWTRQPLQRESLRRGGSRPDRFKY